MASDNCRICGCGMRVTGSREVVKGDNAPDTKTQVFTVLTLECVNPQCSERGKKQDVSIEREVQHEE
ncbi:MAG: hypothetical protein VB082_02985 [Christensenella sp.]|nr:hypothetical protein [Christensenella sp.]